MHVSDFDPTGEDCVGSHGLDFCNDDQSTALIAAWAFDQQLSGASDWQQQQSQREFVGRFTTEGFAESEQPATLGCFYNGDQSAAKNCNLV